MQSARSYAAEQVREQVLSGRLGDGARINEVVLADALQISRTPLREALFDLAADGFVESIPRKGFFVRPLALEEFDGLYDIRPLLDPEALRLAGIPGPPTLDRLAAIDERFAAAATPAEAVAADDGFHLLLIAGCPNRVLYELIEQIIRRTRRYELALFRETAQVPRASGEHARLLQCLRGRDLPGAIEALEANLRSGKEPIRRWLVQRTGART